MSSTSTGKMRGHELIAYERGRQVEQEGWTPEHDDEHASGEMAQAAAVYAMPEQMRMDTQAGDYWPWSPGWWKPSPGGRIRELTKAGALIAAEIDRLQRLATRTPPSHE